MSTFETWYRSTLTAKLNPTDTTVSVDVPPAVTHGRMHIYKWNIHSWIKYTWVTWNTLTGVTFVSQTAEPIAVETGLIFPAGSKIELVAMHDQLLDKTEPTSSVQIATTYETTTARDTALGGNWVATYPYVDIYVEVTGLYYNYNLSSNQWESLDVWTPVSNASTTVAGKVEVPTNIETSTGEATWGTWASLAMSPQNLMDIYYFGDGSDGNVTITTNTTLTRDMYYNDLTVDTWVTLNPAWYAVYVLGTLTLTGTAKIARNWNNGVSTTGGAALATWTCWPCLGWGNGGSAGTGIAGGNWTNGTAVAVSYKTTWSSAAWGNGGAGTNPAWTWGTAASHTQWALYNKIHTLSNALQIVAMPSRVLSFTQYWGLASSGGGGGGGSVASWIWGAGGGAWGNWGIIMVFANTIAGTWTLEAIWGAGANWANGSWANQWGGGGGGGGWNWGVVVLVYRTWTPYTVTVTWGAAWVFWLWVNGGSNGVGGTAWTAWQSIIVNV